MPDVFIICGGASVSQIHAIARYKLTTMILADGKLVTLVLRRSDAQGSNRSYHDSSEYFSKHRESRDKETCLR